MNDISSTAESNTAWRCTKCGNLTRFDVEVSTRVRAYYHFSVSGELSVEDPEVIDERFDSIRCRWCGAEGDAIQH